MSSDWTTLGVGIVTASAALIGSSIQSRSIRRHAREQWEREQQTARLTYQVETLLELQLVLQRLGRAYHQVHFENVMHHRQTREPFGENFIDPRWDREILEASTAAHLLTSRVRDPELRVIVQTAHTTIAAVGHAKSEPESDQALIGASIAANAAIDAVGEALRELPPPAVYHPIVTSPLSIANDPD